MKRAFFIITAILICFHCLAQSVTIDGITYKVKDGEAYVSKSEKDIEVANIRSEVTIKNKNYSVTAIGTRVIIWNPPFSERKKLKYVNIPNSIRYIGTLAFQGCGNLTEITVPDTPIKIEYYTNKSGIVGPFSGCQLLTTIRCHDGSSPAYVLPYIPKNCPFSVTYQMQPRSESNSGLAQLQPKDATAPTVTAPQPRQLVSDVDELPTAGVKDNVNTFAVIFANEHYRREAAVEYAQNDGQMFKKYCESLLGLPARNIHYVEDATLNDVLAEFDWLSKVGKAYGKDANIIVYYAGHGIPDEQGNHAYLLPTDGIGNNVNTGYSLHRLYDLLSELDAQKITVFLDACFSGSKRGEGMLASARGVAIKTKSESPRGNLVVFSAATSDETAYPFEENGHGLFTYFLLKKLKETSGHCSLGELGDYLTTQVSRHSIVVNSKSQTPCITASPALQSTWRNLKLK